MGLKERVARKGQKAVSGRQVVWTGWASAGDWPEEGWRTGVVECGIGWNWKTAKQRRRTRVDPVHSLESQAGEGQGRAVW